MKLVSLLLSSILILNTPHDYNFNHFIKNSICDETVIPKDNYSYIFDEYTVNSITKDFNYKNIESKIYYNNTNSSKKETYRITKNTIVNANINPLLLYNSKYLKSFLDKSQNQINETVLTRKEIEEESGIIIGFDLPPKTKLTINNFQVGYIIKGNLCWKRYSKSGTFLGYYKKEANSSLLSSNSTNIELTEAYQNE